LNWIRLQSEYFRHRKTLRLVRRLGEVAALYPIRLWTWAVEQSIDGSLQDIDAEELAMICGFAGDAGVLWSAMTDCGFIELEDGRASIRSWDKHQGKLIDRAERNRVRTRAARTQHEARTCLATDVTNERNETDETNDPPPAPEPLPLVLDTPAFREAWSDWQAYRRERKLGKWAPRTVKTKLAELAGMGEPSAVQSIRESIGNGWSGLFAPKSATKPANCFRCGGKGVVTIPDPAGSCAVYNPETGQSERPTLTEPCPRCAGAKAA
jgi:hypothetical protein